MAVLARDAREALNVARDMMARVEYVEVTDADGKPYDLGELERLAAESEAKNG